MLYDYFYKLLGNDACELLTLSVRVFEYTKVFAQLSRLTFSDLFLFPYLQGMLITYDKQVVTGYIISYSVLLINF